MARYDLAVVGFGAAGMMAAIQAGRAAPGLKIIALDGARKLGAKVLVAGGGRCNVTHHAVDAEQYATSGDRGFIKKVLRAWTVKDTVRFFEALGVELKREETGKLFPTTDSAQTVLDALLRAAADARVEVVHPWRVGGVRRVDGGFVVERDLEWEARHTKGGGTDGPAKVEARAVVMTTGGRALPRTGSDGGGYAVVGGLGHSITERVTPALVPLTVDKNQTFLTELSGVTLDAGLEVRLSDQKRVARYENSTLLTHFGLSGPAPMDISRYLIDAQAHHKGVKLVMNWLPGEQLDSVDRWLAGLGAKSVRRGIGERLPDRVVDAVCAHAGVDGSVPASNLPKAQRKELARSLAEMVIPVTGDRGYSHAEVTAGGVPLGEIDAKTMGSLRCEGLWLAGELCDVDGRIGGFNFQWAWASGTVAGRAAARALASV